jgi:microcystin-dependent protein
MKKKIFTLLLLTIGWMGLKAQQPFVGEIRMFAGNFAPMGWAFCDGSTIAISEYETLFMLIGTTYGGDGQSTFALPDLRGRAPMHQGNGYVIGEMAGTESVTLTTNQIPSHTHAAVVKLPVSGEVSNADTPVGNVAGVNAARGNEYNSTANVTMGKMSYTASPNSSVAGGSEPHENMKPFVTINYIISLYGIFPSQQ